MDGTIFVSDSKTTTFYVLNILENTNNYRNMLCD